MPVSDSYQQFSMKKLTNQLIGACAYMQGIRVLKLQVWSFYNVLGLLIIFSFF